MVLAATLKQITEAEESRDNIVTDGTATITYGMLPTLLVSIGDFLAEHGGCTPGCVAVECPNTVAGALTLLYLLQQEVSMVLLPPSEQDDHASEWKPIPQFCQLRLVVKQMSKAEKAAATEQSAREWLQDPTNFLHLEENPAYRPPADLSLLGPGHLMLRTSGSMGASKLVVHRQEKLLGNAQNCVVKYNFTSADRAVIPVPLAHMYGFGAEFLPAVLVGASIDLQEKTNLLRYMARERAFQPTIAFITPAICAMLLKGFKRPRTNYKVIVTSGQRINETLFRDFDDRVNHCLVNQYGSSEMGAIAACDPDAHQDLKATTIGSPMRGVELTIETHDPPGSHGATADGTHANERMGALRCQHPHGFEGYVDEAGQWLHRHLANEWYSTGDLAKEQRSGFIQVVGRSGDSVNRRGYLIQLADIERQMEQIPLIQQVVVVQAAGTTRKSRHEEDAPLAALCVIKQNQQTTPKQLRQHCFDLLPAHAIPDEVLILDALPLLPSGKVDRQALAAMTA